MHLEAKRRTLDISVTSEHLFNKSGVQVLPDLGSMTMVAENHNPEVIVVVWFPIVLGSFAFEFNVNFTAKYLRPISPSRGVRAVFRAVL